MSTRKPKQPKLVRYCSPFGTPAWMPLEVAQRYLEQDDARWERATSGRYGAIENYLTPQQRAYGPPRIEHIQ